MVGRTGHGKHLKAAQAALVPTALTLGLLAICREVQRIQRDMPCIIALVMWGLAWAVWRRAARLCTVQAAAAGHSLVWKYVKLTCSTQGEVSGSNSEAGLACSCEAQPKRSMQTLDKVPG